MFSSVTEDLVKNVYYKKILKAQNPEASVSVGIKCVWALLATLFGQTTSQKDNQLNFVAQKVELVVQ